MIDRLKLKLTGGPLAPHSQESLTGSGMATQRPQEVMTGSGSVAQRPQEFLTG